MSTAGTALPPRTCGCGHRRYDHEWEQGNACFKCPCVLYKPTTNETPEKNGGGPR